MVMRGMKKLFNLQILSAVFHLGTDITIVDLQKIFFPDFCVLFSVHLPVAYEENSLLFVMSTQEF